MLIRIGKPHNTTVSIEKELLDLYSMVTQDMLYDVNKKDINNQIRVLYKKYKSSRLIQIHLINVCLELQKHPLKAKTKAT